MSVDSPPNSLAVVSVFSCLLVFCIGCGASPSVPSAPVEQAQPGLDAEQFEQKITHFCAGCHGMPRPGSFPKDDWEEEVEQGYSLFFDSSRTDLKPPSPKRLVVDYFRDQAPVELKISFPNATTAPPVDFRRQEVQVSTGEQPIYVSHLRHVPATATRKAGLVACDMYHGRVVWTDPMATDSGGTVLETFHNPAYVELTDLDRDNQLDYVVADLGSFLPADHNRGKVYWLRQNPADGAWEKQILLSGVGRVASVEVGDFDEDSRLDLIVAEFGWRKTGGIHLLRNQTTDTGNLQFKDELIDPRSGAIHVHQCDLNSDGHLDFVAVLSQEHEKVVVFLNNGDGVFEEETLWAAGYPSYGSSGIELVDLDQDGDLDVIYTNGDSFDDFRIKPHHSIQWLENRGSYPFIHHELTKMPGVHRALPGDFDDDGDLDIVAVAMLPGDVRNPETVARLDSVILLEQVDGSFIRHPLETGELTHASVAVGDFDDDNDLDLAVGVLWHQEQTSRLTLWWNQLHKRDQ